MSSQQMVEWVLGQFQIKLKCNWTCEVELNCEVEKSTRHNPFPFFRPMDLSILIILTSPFLVLGVLVDISFSLYFA